ncbi:hypothetical protein DRN63_02410 [Nanoarchaeota archaeon]|nr:MAG: hypothetical protein DRN63_02410 [Nanoarchaeota archaeon]
MLDRTTEELWIKYLNPNETIFPAEIHELARGLLNAYIKMVKDRRRYLASKLGELTLTDFIAQMIERYGNYIEEYARKYKIEESPEVFKWLKDLTIPTIQGILFAKGWGLGAPVIKVFILALYFVKRSWNKRSLRKTLNLLEKYLRTEGKKSINDYKTWLDLESKKVERALYSEVWSSSPEVDELAELLRKAREKIYWKVLK